MNTINGLLLGFGVGILLFLAVIMVIALPLWGCLVLAGVNLGYWNTVGVVGAGAIITVLIKEAFSSK